MKITNPIYQAACPLIKSALSSVYKDIRRIQLSKDTKATINEFNTIKICGPRRCGHTTAIIHIINEFFNNTTIVVHYSHRMEDFFLNVLRKEYDKSKEPYRKISNFDILLGKNKRIINGSINNIDHLRGIGNVDAIIVDVASLISHSKIESLVNEVVVPMAQYNPDILLILLE